MSNRVEVSPSGVGFIRTTAKKSIPNAPVALKVAPRRAWLLRRDATEPTHTAKGASATSSPKQ